MNIRQQFMSIHQDKSLTADQKKQKIELLKSHIHARIDKILTPAQQHELGKLKAKFRQEHWHPGPDSTGQQ
jgi:Spy/CpxP family protein refolding chaperone